MLSTIQRVFITFNYPTRRFLYYFIAIVFINNFTVNLENLWIDFSDLLYCLILSFIFLHGIPNLCEQLAWLWVLNIIQSRYKPDTCSYAICNNALSTCQCPPTIHQNVYILQAFLAVIYLLEYMIPICTCWTVTARQDITFPTIICF